MTVFKNKPHLTHKLVSDIIKTYRHLNEVKTLKTKEKIMKEALNLFAEKGYKAVGVGEIAAAVGIKPPSLYKHYKSKQAIFDSIIARMNARDSEQSKSCTMPQKSAEEDSDGYKGIPNEKIREYTLSMFSYWTQDEFACNFRKLLTVEQYKNANSQKMYHQYICGGPIGYMTDIFFEYTGSRQNAYELAVEFYSPMFLMYSLYDGGVPFGVLSDMLDNRIREFFKKLDYHG